MARLLAVVLMAALALGASVSLARADLQAGVDAYYDGNFAVALENLQPEADAGDPVAQYFLGEMHLRGKGVDQNFEQAAAWYEKAAVGGHAGLDLIHAAVRGGRSGLQQDVAGFAVSQPRTEYTLCALEYLAARLGIQGEQPAYNAFFLGALQIGQSGNFRISGDKTHAAVLGIDDNVFEFGLGAT